MNDHMEADKRLYSKSAAAELVFPYFRTFTDLVRVLRFTTKSRQSANGPILAIVIANLIVSMCGNYQRPD